MFVSDSPPSRPPVPQLTPQNLYGVGVSVHVCQVQDFINPPIGRQNPEA